MKRSAAGAARALSRCLCGLLAACAELPRVPSNECGNSVIEAGEDCDTFGGDARFLCRPKGAVGACRFDCSPSAEGARAACPAGWGCDESGLCREPTGNFARARDHTIGPVQGLVAGDFDGDGRADLISREPPDALDQSKIAFHYFDERGVLVETRAFPKALTAPVLTDVSGDQSLDLVFSDYRVGLLLGRADRGLVPETFSSYRVPDSAVRMVGVYDGFIGFATSLVTVSAFEGVPSLSAADSDTARLRRLAELPGAIENAVSDPVAGNIVESELSPCGEIVLGLRGESSFWLFDVCQRHDVTGNPVWREQAESARVALVPEAEIDGPLMVVDMNGDGHLDVLLGAAGQAYVAHGDGARLADAVPFSFTLLDFTSRSEVSTLPLAAGDFSGDGRVDFVFEDRLVASIPPFGGAAPHYEVSYANLAAPWTVARLADLNGKGNIGIVAASSAGLGIDVFSGTGSRYPTWTRIATDQPVQFLEVGDFDGDLTNDVAFVEQPAAGETRQALSIAFGQLGRPPSEPVPIGRLLKPEQLALYRRVARTDMVVASYQSEPSPSGTLSFLDGNPDRIPFAPYPLVSFSADGNLQEYPAVSLIVGAFAEPGRADVVAMGSSRDGFQFWLVPDLAQGLSTPFRLENGELDQNLVPVLEPGSQGRIRLAGTAVDLDGDGRAEALWAMQNESDQCTLLTFGVDARSTPTLIARDSLELLEGCEDPELAAIDLDADGAPEILLLSGERGADDRKLSLLWNDGSGGFSRSQMIQVNEAAHLPEGFASLPETTARPLSLVYVTKDAAFMLSVLGERRGFGAARALTDLDRGSGVVAADLNGDGADDLAFADGSKLRVLFAELKTP